MKDKRYVVLASGRGSNLKSLLEAGLPGECAVVICNRPGAGALSVAQAHGIAMVVIDHAQYPSRETFDAALVEEIERHQPDLILLAGFTRILTDGFVRHFAGRMLNIHPSLLPAFPGMATHALALASGVRIHGCTVHFVTPDLDSGPIVLQAAVPVLDGDTEAALAARVLAREHVVYPMAAAWFLKGQLTLDGRRVAYSGPQSESAWLCSPPA